MYSVYIVLFRQNVNVRDLTAFRVKQISHLLASDWLIIAYEGSN